MSNKMWGARYSEGPDAIMEEINVSIDVDRHMYAQDIAASKAHAAMLADQGIITASDAKNIAKGLDTILAEMSKGDFDFKRALEDIHMNVESRLTELIGPAAGRGQGLFMKPRDSTQKRQELHSNIASYLPVLATCRTTHRR
jgi:argininosuccinate lyase